MVKWSDLLSDEAMQLSVQLAGTAKLERERGKTIYPPQEQIFRALNLTPPEKVKVCLIGQDPYHTPGQADGLAFSISSGNKLQPSLVNIFKELQEDCGIPAPPDGDLSRWAHNGVLLLNTTLTVYEGQPNSCATWGWDKFTKEVLQKATKLPQPIVFILLGASAQNLLKDLLSCAAIIEDNGHIIRENLIKKAYVLSSHPSPFSATKPCKNTPPFRGSKPFSATNKLLVEMGGEEIDWRLA